jgi:hypothetical protein
MVLGNNTIRRPDDENITGEIHKTLDFNKSSVARLFTVNSPENTSRHLL